MKKISFGLLLTLLVLIGMINAMFVAKNVNGDSDRYEAEKFPWFEETQLIDSQRKGEKGQAIITEHRITVSELEQLIQSVGVWEEGKDYNEIIAGHGTGLCPPTEKQWEDIAEKTYVVDKIRFDQNIGALSNVDHSTTPWFPPIGDQASEGSCTTWAVGYYMKTFQEAKEHGWNLSGAEWGGSHPSAGYQDKIFSPDFIYHQINGGVDGGSSFYDAINLVCSVGICSWEKMPYADYDSTSWPSEDAWREAPLYRGNSTGYEYMEITTDTDITSLKNWIASDHLVTIPVDATRYSSSISQDLWTLDNYVDPQVNHANTIVGYDDSIEYTEENETRYGAFKIANSWGVGGNWENVSDGFYWVSYETMKQRIGLCMFCRDRVDYDPKLVASFEMRHSRRAECDITFGIGNESDPFQEKKFSNWTHDGGNHPFCTNKIVLDVSEFEDAVPAVVNESFFMRVYDGGVSEAHSGIYEWYSDGIAWSWFRLNRTFDIPETGATLKFWSSFEIEEDWDYGYVEVYDLDTDEWYTLPGLMTVSTLPERQDNPNCPAEFEPTTYYDAERWNAFTGLSGVMYQEEMDLTPFANHTINLSFTYWTDGYVLEPGWYVDDIEIQEVGFFDDVENGTNNWTYNGWNIVTPPPSPTGKALSFSIEYYNSYIAGSLNAMSTSYDLPANTSNQEYVVAELTFENVLVVDDDGPADFDTIQKAINNATPGGIVYVVEGTYHERITVNKTLLVLGESSTLTAIDGDGAGTVVHVTESNATVNSFNIRNSGDSLDQIPNCGILVDNSDGIHLGGNILSNNSFGIYLNSSSGSTLRNNNITGNIHDFFVSGDPTYGYLHFLHDIDKTNTVNQLPIYYWISKSDEHIPSDAGCVYLVNCFNVIVKDIEITHNEVSLVNTNNSIIEDVRVSFGTVNLLSSHCNTIESSNLTNSGISLSWSANNTVADNMMTNHSYGVSLYSSGWYTIPSNNLIVGNTISNCELGISILEEANSHNNTIYNNNFINNTAHVDNFDSANLWDNNYPSGGNYWDNYTGTDFYNGPYQNLTGNDGIGDTPYTIEGHTGVDHFPLKNPYPCIHAVAINNVTSHAPQGPTVEIDVVVANQGHFSETLNITAYANTTSVGGQIIALTKRNVSTITILWNLTGFSLGNYTLSAHVSPVEDEIYTADNTYTDGTFLWGIPGDVNADGKVDVFDAVLLSAASGSTPGDENWNPNADLNGDLIVDVFDAVILSAHAGEEI